MRVYQKISAYLTTKGIATDTLSENTGIPQSRLSSLLNGEETLYASDLKAICLTLNISPETFIDTQGGNEK